MPARIRSTTRVACACHSDDSIQVKYFDRPEGFSRKGAFSVHLRLGLRDRRRRSCGAGDADSPVPILPGLHGLQPILVLPGSFGLTIGGGAMTNPGRYLVLVPPINGATAASGTPYFTANPGDPVQGVGRLGDRRLHAESVPDHPPRVHPQASQRSILRGTRRSYPNRRQPGCAGQPRRRLRSGPCEEREPDRRRPADRICECEGRARCNKRTQRTSKLCATRMEKGWIMKTNRFALGFFLVLWKGCATSRTARSTDPSLAAASACAGVPEAEVGANPLRSGRVLAVEPLGVLRRHERLSRPQGRHGDCGRFSGNDAAVDAAIVRVQCRAASLAGDGAVEEGPCPLKLVKDVPDRGRSL